MINKVLSTELSESFTLRDISISQRLDEMEFYFPIQNIQLEKIISLFQKHYKNDERLVFAEDLLSLNYEMDQGFLNGAIDF